MTTTNQGSTTISRSELKASLDLFEIKPGVKFSKQVLMDLLPDVETVLFFAKVYALDYVQLSDLIYQVVRTPLVEALMSGDHSTELQGYLLDGFSMHEGHCPVAQWGEGEECLCSPAWYPGVLLNTPEAGSVTFDPEVPKGEILPEVWKDLEVEIAKAIKDVAAKLESVVSMLPGKQGSMVFKSMMTLNRNRPTFGDHKAAIHHDPVKENLVVLDVSGSMTEQTVRAIVEDVVAMSYMANAHFAIVSNGVTYWEPGTYSVDDILAAAEYGGTHYEQLAPVFTRDWGTVICVADYDSSPAAEKKLRQACGGHHIDTVLDISLVNRPTYLSECIGWMASEVRPLLVGQSVYVVGSYYDEHYS